MLNIEHERKRNAERRRVKESRLVVCRCGAANYFRIVSKNDNAEDTIDALLDEIERLRGAANR